MPVAIGRVTSAIFNTYYRFLEAYYRALEKLAGLLAEKS